MRWILAILSRFIGGICCWSVAAATCYACLLLIPYFNANVGDSNLGMAFLFMFILIDGFLSVGSCCLVGIVCMYPQLVYGSESVGSNDLFPTRRVSNLISNLEKNSCKCWNRDNCCICLGPILEDGSIYSICHVFHKDCIKLWIHKGNFTCPMCRQDLKPIKYEFIV